MSMTWRPMGLADIARHGVGCQLTQATRVETALDDAAGNMWQAPSGGGEGDGASEARSEDEERGDGLRNSGSGGGGGAG